MEKRFLNSEELAVYLGLSIHTIRQWTREGKLPFVKLGSAVRFDMQKIEKWVKSKECAYVRREFKHL